MVAGTLVVKGGQFYRKLRRNQCPICESEDTTVFFRWGGAIIHQQILTLTEEEARNVRRGDIELTFCHRCGLIWNSSFEHSLLGYSPLYEASQAPSPIFREYVEDIVKYLITKYDLHSKDILEIGCGDGFFLKLICRLGHNRGAGFDPGWRTQDDGSMQDNVIFIPDYYSERYAEHQGDLVCSRHVLEHIQNPTEFLRELARLTQSRQSVFFFEVPNITWSLHQTAFWDIYYEHYLYFSQASLKYLFTLCDFSILDVTERFGGQYSCIEALFSPQKSKGLDSGVSEELGRLAREVEAFCGSYQRMIEYWGREIDKLAVSGKNQVAVWGAGAKGVTFLNMLDITPARISLVIDINPKKQGTYIPGTGQKIVPPEFLKQHKPDIILVMNPEYLSEIGDILKDMSITVELRAVGAETEVP